MPFVTTIRLESGDRARLESVAADVKDDAARKGVEIKGPHSESSAELRVPQSKTLGPGSARFPSWDYTVYARRFEIVGHQDFAREMAGRGYPAGIRVEVDVDQRKQVGGN